MLKYADKYTFTNIATGATCHTFALITSDSERIKAECGVADVPGGVHVSGLIYTVRCGQWDNVPRVALALGLTVSITPYPYNA